MSKMWNTEEILKYCGLSVTLNAMCERDWRFPGPNATFHYYDEVLKLGEVHHTHFEPAGPRELAVKNNARQFDRMNTRIIKVRGFMEKLPSARRRKGQ